MARYCLAPLLLLAVLATQLPLVKATNFFGFDEWTVLVLLSKGVIDIPYANRPLELLWALPVPWIAPHSFLGFTVLHWLYLWLTAVMVAWMALRLTPGRPLLALLAGVFVMIWAPTDSARLSTVERTLYGGITFGMTLCMAVYVESWVRRSVPMLALSLLLCVMSGRCYEATLPVLFVAPLLLVMLGGPYLEMRRWFLALEGFVLLGMILALQSLLFPTEDPSYQAAFGLDSRPAAVLTRGILQYRLHFQPLFTIRAAELLAPAVGVAALVFVVAGFLWLRVISTTSAQRGDLRLLIGAGLLLCGAGYGALLLSGRMPGPWRMQFLSSPGAALLLAGLVLAFAERFKAGSWLVALALGAWVVAVGTGRTRAMQDEWDRSSFYPRQMRMLTSLIDVVPDVEPGSMIVLIDDGQAWRANFGFHHAVEYLYAGRAVGLVWGPWPGMFPAFFGPEGVASLPWPAVRAAWGEKATFHHYDQVVVARHTVGGAVLIMDEWPSELPPVPAGASYNPRARIRPASASIPERRALSSLDAGG